MIIGVDIDGVITDMFEIVIPMAYSYALKNNIKLKRYKKYKCMQEYIGWDKTCDCTFWKNIIWEYAEKVKPIKNCAKYMQKLHEENNKLIIVTKRQHSSEKTEDGSKMRNIVLKWLKDYNIPYDSIYFIDDDDNKYNICSKFGVEIFIDDFCVNLDDVAKHIPAICMVNKSNKKYKNKNVTKCKSWKSVYKTINKFKNKKRAK